MTFRETLERLTLHAREMRVLYVEDEPLIRENMRMLLETIFGEVETAQNGAEGLRRFHNRPFEIVITDILMPEMNGVTMIRRIKELDARQHFVVTSACEESSYLLELINLEVAQFLLKPIQTEHMIRVLYDIVENIYNERKVGELTARLQQEVLHQSTLLEEYKTAVDLSTIVMKMDLHGNITYANELFCQSSGYDRDEIVSQNYRMFYHPENPPEIDEELWKTLLGKKVWNGTLKNIGKYGGVYMTDTTIKPILDEYGLIVEFISISHDVTELFDLNDEILQTQHEMLSLLGEVGETRSQETGNHVRRVAQYCRLLGELSGLHEEQTQLLYSASPMHDIGKIGIPDAILLKPGKLDPDEYEVMKTHSTIGYDILKNSERPLLQAAAIIAREHHEKYDGTGYPRALRGEEIHIFGRITALADVFDALSCERVYKKAWPMERIINLISEERGKHFDPVLVDLFMANIDRFRAIAAEYRD